MTLDYEDVEKYKENIPIRVIEECTELIHAITKAERFGYKDWHPNLPQITNLQQIKYEIQDVINYCLKMDEYLDKLIIGD